MANDSPNGRGRQSKGSSNSFEPTGDRPSNLVGTVLLHEVETFDDQVVLIREASERSARVEGPLPTKRLYLKNDV